MKALIIYQGKYGATQQYAQWLAEALAIPVHAASEVNTETLKKYDTLLIGSSVYVGKLQVAAWWKKNVQELQSKKIFFFQVAGTPVAEMGKRLAYNKGLAAITEKFECYLLPGRLVRKGLSFWDKFLLKAGARLAPDPGDRANMLRDYDDVKRENLEVLIERVKEYGAGR